MRLRRLLVPATALAASVGCANGPVDPFELVVHDVRADVEHPELSVLPDGTLAQRYLVQVRSDLFHEGFGAAVISDLILTHDVAAEAVFTNVYGGFAAALTDDQVAKLRARPDVEAVIEDAPVYAVKGPPFGGGGSTAPATDWGIVDVMGTSAPISSATGAGVTVAVLDTGIDTDHPALPGHLCLGDFSADATGSCEDGNKHGTHVAGTIAAATTSPTHRGIAPDVTLIVGKVLGANGGSYAGIAMGIDAAVGAGADVINMSLGGSASGTSEASDPMCVAINDANSAGTVSVVAAGNDARDAKDFTPARCDGALTVAAYDSAGKLASFTNFGADVDIAGPGVSIYSTSLGGGFERLSGTSMASPHAAAVAALFLQDNPNATPEQVRAGVVANSQNRGSAAAYSRKIALPNTPKLDGTDY